MRGLALLAVLVVCAGPMGAAQAEPGRQPVWPFDVDDGLASSHVRRIVTDSQGFLWFCTAKGLSRFDGESFVTFDADDGLAGPVVLDLLEGADRTYWVGTSSGLYRFDGERPPSGAALFDRVELPVGGAVRRLLLDHRGRIWVGTSEGLAVLEKTPGLQPRRILPTSGGTGEPTAVMALLEDAEGAIWAGTQESGLCRVGPGLEVDRCFPGDTPGLNFIRDLVADAGGDIWCSFFGGVARLHSRPLSHTNPVAEIFDHESGLPSVDTGYLLPDASGEILVGTTAGVARLARDASGAWRVSVPWTTREGLTSDLVQALAFDPAGNLWIGTSARGAMKVVRTGFRRFLEAEEGASAIVRLIGDGFGGMVALSAVQARRYRLHHFDRTGHTALDVGLPPGISYLGWGRQRIALDRSGAWWVGTGRGLLRYRAVGGPGISRLQSPPDGEFGRGDGLPGVDVYAVFADSRGAVWVSVSQPAPGGSSVAVREAGAQRFTVLPSEVGDGPGDVATGFVEDPTGTVWIEFASGRVTRVRPDRTYTPVSLEPSLARRWEPRLFFDSRGRLWIASQGVAVVDTPSSDSLRARPGPEVLRDSTVFCAVEDGAGRLYFGTDGGVVRFDEGTGAVRRFTPADGLPGYSILFCAKDGGGDLWFGDVHGLARLTPWVDEPQAPPQVRIASVRVDGADLPVAPLGSRSVGPLTLKARPRQLRVEYLAILHAPGGRVRFQHRFDDASAWSVPSETRALDFPRLSPGKHRLAIRAVSGQGEPAPPAILELVVPAPVWQRPWFVAVVLATAIAAVVAVYRVRLARALAIERMRTRIATDLHDEVGADLSRISMLADVVTRNLETDPSRARAMLADVARTARDAVADMSDIVWALKPTRENLGEVVARLRDFVADFAPRAGIAVDVVAAEDLEGVPLSGDQRRELYLLLKEAIANAVRHSGAHAVELEVRRSDRGVVATLRDDGRGFAADAPRPGRGGHGLAHMRARADRIGGNLTIVSAPGRGTTIRIELPRA